MTSEKTRAGAVDDEDPLASDTDSPLTQRRQWYALPQRRTWRPPTDVYETDESIVVKVEVAGMQVEDFDISFVQRRLIIAGRRRDPVGKIIYQNMEIRYGEFRTEVRVGWALDQAAIEATYDAGFLYVSLPKRAEEHRIAVQVVEGSDE